MTENTNDLDARQHLCSECDTPLRTAEAHVCDTCIAEDDFDNEMRRFEFDIDAYIDWKYESCDDY